MYDAQSPGHLPRKVAVNLFAGGPRAIETIDAAAPYVTLRLGQNAAFRCHIKNCRNSQRIWSVLNFDISEGTETTTGGQTRGCVRARVCPGGGQLEGISTAATSGPDFRLACRMPAKLPRAYRHRAKFARMLLSSAHSRAIWGRISDEHRSAPQKSAIPARVWPIAVKLTSNLACLSRPNSGQI